MSTAQEVSEHFTRLLKGTVKPELRVVDHGGTHFTVVLFDAISDRPMSEVNNEISQILRNKRQR